MKSQNGIIEYYDNGYLRVTCGRVTIEATARLDTGPAGQVLRGTVRRGPTQTIGRGITVGTTDCIGAHVHITN